jgi:hypothetical protein
MQAAAVEAKREQQPVPVRVPVSGLVLARVQGQARAVREQAQARPHPWGPLRVRNRAQPSIPSHSSLDSLP